MIAVGDLRPLAFFDGLTDAQLAELVADGDDVRVEPGVVLWHEGEPADFWWVLVDGAVELVRHVGREDVVGRMDVPGRWAGGFRAWDEHGVYLASARGVAAGRLLRVPAERLRERSDAWSPFGGRLIEGLYRTARTIEATARQRESLLTLGTLAAGLAHEINNPAAAASRAVEALSGTTGTLLSSLGRLARAALTPQQFSVLDDLRSQVAAGAGRVDPLAVADLEEDLSTWLDDHGVERGWLIASALAAAGADVDWCERVADALPGPTLAPALEWAASTFTVTALLAELAESTRRVSELVAAVQSYSQVDRASRQAVDLTEGLESTLVMLGHKVGSVRVVRDHAADVPPVDVYPGELNQVWTNLIDNALDAMDGAGTLRLTTRRDGDDVVVEVADTGPGIPPAVAARAFDAFFTTKDVGKGTGLGLDIARRIVEERHGGTISIDSRPGDTVLRVRLPLRAGS